MAAAAARSLSGVDLQYRPFRVGILMRQCGIARQGETVTG
jgi:hypothetical protein